MSHWKESLDIKKSTGDGVTMCARRIFCAFFLIVGCLFLVDGLTDYSLTDTSAKKTTAVESQSENNVNAESYNRENDNRENDNRKNDNRENPDDENPYKPNDNSEVEELFKPDFAALKLINPDIVAWIRIPGMSIDEPIVQAADNEYYLNTGFDGKKDPAGTVFLDFESAPDASDYHSIFYGHHMKNGSRFAELTRLKDEDFFENHRTIFLYFPDERRRELRIIAALAADSASERRKTEFADFNELNDYMRKMTDGCIFRHLPDNTVLHLYSFVTCSYEFKGARTIVYAVDES